MLISTRNAPSKSFFAKGYDMSKKTIRLDFETFSDIPLPSRYEVRSIQARAVYLVETRAPAGDWRPTGAGVFMRASDAERWLKDGWKFINKTHEWRVTEYRPVAVPDPKYIVQWRYETNAGRKDRWKLLDCEPFASLKLAEGEAAGRQRALPGFEFRAIKAT